jgi:hypothetical protein
MKTFKDGGPAFPVTTEHGSVFPLPGMTLRDYFAAAALQGMLADSQCNGPVEGYANDAYQYADAMLAERAKTKGGAA